MRPLLNTLVVKFEYILGYRRYIGILIGNKEHLTYMLF